MGRLRSPVVRRLLQPHATVLAQGGAGLRPVLGRRGLDASDVETGWREHGFDRVEATRPVVREPDGSMGVVPADQPRVRVPRRAGSVRRP